MLVGEQPNEVEENANIFEKTPSALSIHIDKTLTYYNPVKSKTENFNTSQTVTKIGNIEAVKDSFKIKEVTFSEYKNKNTELTKTKLTKELQGQERQDALGAHNKALNSHRRDYDSRKQSFGSLKSDFSSARENPAPSKLNPLSVEFRNTPLSKIYQPPLQPYRKRQRINTNPEELDLSSTRPEETTRNRSKLYQS